MWSDAYLRRQGMRPTVKKAKMPPMSTGNRAALLAAPALCAAALACSSTPNGVRPAWAEAVARGERSAPAATVAAGGSFALGGQAGENSPTTRKTITLGGPPNNKVDILFVDRLVGRSGDASEALRPDPGLSERPQGLGDAARPAHRPHHRRHGRARRPGGNDSSFARRPETTVPSGAPPPGTASPPRSPPVRRISPMTDAARRTSPDPPPTFFNASSRSATAGAAFRNRSRRWRTRSAPTTWPERRADATGDQRGVPAPGRGAGSHLPRQPGRLLGASRDPLFSLDGGEQNLANPLGPLQDYRCNQCGHLCQDPAMRRHPHAAADAAGRRARHPRGTDARPRQLQGQRPGHRSSDTGEPVHPDHECAQAGRRTAKFSLRRSWRRHLPTRSVDARADGENTQPGELWPEVEHSCGAPGADGLNPEVTMDPRRQLRRSRRTYPQFANNFARASSPRSATPATRRAFKRSPRRSPRCPNRPELPRGQIQRDDYGQPTCTVTATICERQRRHPGRPLPELRREREHRPLLDAGVRRRGLRRPSLVVNDAPGQPSLVGHGDLLDLQAGRAPCWVADAGRQRGWQTDISWSIDDSPTVQKVVDAGAVGGGAPGGRRRRGDVALEHDARARSRPRSSCSTASSPDATPSISAAS